MYAVGETSYSNDFKRETPARGVPSSSRQRVSGVPGELLVGRYELVSEIGRGAMGVVFRARDLRLDRLVAVELLKTGRIENPTSVERFQREALASGWIGHENVCDVRDQGRSAEGVPFFVMELLDAEPRWPPLAARDDP